MTGAYTEATVIEAEGVRVMLVNCMNCGAAILIDPRDRYSMKDIHDQWHATVLRRLYGEEGRA